MQLDLVVLVMKRATEKLSILSLIGFLNISNHSVKIS